MKRVVLFVVIFFSMLGLAKGQGSSVRTTEPMDTTVSECSHLQDEGEGLFHQNEYQMANDTLRFFIEHCANQTAYQPWLEFFTIKDAVYDLYRPTYDSVRWEEFREWLKSVLYLNTTEFHYYCSDVACIINSMQYFRGRGNDVNGALAILKYVIDSGKCPAQFFSDTLWSTTRRDQYTLWRDTVKDSIRTPFDSTLPSLDDLNLQILRGNNASVIAGPSSIDARSLEALSVHPNPVIDETEIQYTIRSVAALRLEVFDILGNSVYVEPIGFASEGEHRSRLNTSRWISGTYYARLTSLTGGAMTVKIVKQ